MSIKITIPNSSSDVLTFGSGNTPTAAQIAGIDSGSSNGQLALYTTASGTSTERVRVDASGNVGIGTSSPSYPLVVSHGGAKGIEFIPNSDTTVSEMLAYNRSGASYSDMRYRAGSHQFYVQTTERARIDSSGNLLVGGTTAAARMYVVGAGTTNATVALRVQDSATTDMFYVRNDGLILTGSKSASPYNNTTGSAANMFVDSVGSLYRSTSSLKYKKNVQNAAHGLNQLLTLRPVTYEGKAESDAGKTFGGLIAEEVHEAGLTEFVQYAEDGSPDALAYGNMVSLCVKAIQEQQAIITSLTDRITALENK